MTLSTPERWDRLLLVLAWAYYWLNVAGWYTASFPVIVELSNDGVGMRGLE